MGFFGPPPPPAKPCTIVCPAERHISVAFTEIYNIVKTSMTIGQRQRYEEVCQLVESLYAQEFMTLRRNIKSNFLAFSIGAKGQELPTRKGRSLPSKDDLNMRETKLVADFLQLMAAARYNLVSKKEWSVAMEERFMFHLPVKVNWSYFDDQLLTGFWTSTSERKQLRTMLPDMSDRVLVFHRGIGVAEDSGLYISQKIDLIVQYLIVTPLLRVWAWLCALAASMFRRKPKPVTGTPARPSAPAPVGPPAPNDGVAPAGGPASAGGPAPATDDLTPADMEALTHRAARTVERRTLKRVLPTTWSIIKNFHRNLHLQEPMYKEVVVLYRMSGEGRKTVKSKVPARTRTNTERLKDILSRRNIHVKCFHDIPMADMEVIFPDKKVYLKSLSLINLVVQACMAFFGALAGLRQAGGIDMQALWSALSFVAARCGQLYSSMQAERSDMVQNMVNILYDKTNDAQEGVISMLLEDMAEQQLKEAVLAYTMLFLNIDDEITESHLDDLCEGFLENNFELKLDFAVEDALPSLVNWGMVRRNVKNGMYQAEPVEVAYKALIEHWVHAYEALSRPPSTKVLPLSALLADGDRTPVHDGFHDLDWNGTHAHDTLPGSASMPNSHDDGTGHHHSSPVKKAAKSITKLFKRHKAEPQQPAEPGPASPTAAT